MKTNKRKGKIPSGVWSIVAAVAIGTAMLVATHRARGTVSYAKYSVEVSAARSHQYYPMTSSLRPNEIPWVFDGKFPIRGLVLDAWDADTVPNRKACNDGWAKEMPYIGFCRSLADNQIVAVLLASIDGESITYVPVNKISKLHKGDQVIVRVEGISSDEKIKILPSLANVSQWRSGPLIDAQD